MKFELPALPYAKDGLAPHISANTLNFHYDKHHQAYMANLEKAIGGSADAEKTLEEVIRSSDGGVFNNAAQVWNHAFYWHCMSSGGGQEPGGDLGSAINSEFGSLAGLNDALAQAGATQFGSGWAWLICDADGKLSVTKTANGDTPVRDPALVPLLTIDVWEHAYYLDFQNRRPDYLSTFLTSLANWGFAAENYDQRASGTRTIENL